MAAKYSLHDRGGSAKPRGVPGCTEQVCLLVALAVVAGCSSSATVPVTGTVKHATGEPLSGGRVVFQPTGEGAQSARARILSDGTFRLGTFKTDDGAVPGVHKVAVVPAVPAEAGDDPEVIARYLSTVDRRYQSVQTTPLEFTVKNDGSTNHFDIILEPVNSG